MSAGNPKGFVKPLHGRFICISFSTLGQTSPHASIDRHFRFFIISYTLSVYVRDPFHTSCSLVPVVNFLFSRRVLGTIGTRVIINFNILE